MNKFGIASLISIAGAVFYACGDSTSSNSTMDLPGDQETVTEVGSVYELGKCKDDRKGTIIFVKNENREYVCYSGKWSPLDEIGSVEESSSSVQKDEQSSSSENGKSSSSVDKDDSSSSQDEGESSSSQDEEKSSSSQMKGDASSSSQKEDTSSSSQKDEPLSSSQDVEDNPEVKDDVSSSSEQKEESSSSVKSEESAFFKDPRDNHVYRIVKIGNQTWFAQNLQYAGPVGSSRCHSDDYIQCDVYGRLYQRDKAMTACPTGWHLPSLDEWKVLFEYVGGTNVAGIKLKSRSNWVLQENFEKYAGIDEYNFSVLPASFATATGVYGSTIKFDSHLWTSSVDADGYNVMVYFLHSMGGVGISSVSENLYYSVRCLQDN
ncbi:fibrobacter succinogenes major paralogous domain-containing protein [Fibrobacter sp. HC4]|uniref:fibrobacter succinogenes major paralogous domain-containing protein n=1 Tax=Fibrobacter sp. HC4 TaxID=3239812 RepID=UPI00201910EB|nr:fibrobacter succinogenes major paralogous domain-containing protein [Fibrobacter succinogenes]MCL4100705.1 hypothetical protein [Fibrobacter succinogenes]